LGIVIVKRESLDSSEDGQGGAGGNKKTGVSERETRRDQMTANVNQQLTYSQSISSVYSSLTLTTSIFIQSNDSGQPQKLQM